MSAVAVTPGISAEDHLNGARLHLRTVLPYFRAKILAMRPVAVPGLLASMGGYIGVSKGLVLAYDPDELVKVTVPQLVVDLAHEIGHSNGRHFDRCERLKADPRKWNLAGDAEINDDLTQAIAIWNQRKPGAGYGWFGQCVMPATLGCKDHLLAEAYYKNMKLPPPPKGGGGKEGDGKGERNCGSVAGNKDCPELEKLDKEMGKSGREQKRLDRQTARAIQEHAEAKGRGSVPAGWLTWAGELLKPAKVPWQSILQRAVRMAVAWKAGGVDLRYTKVSRRQAGCGWGMGCPRIPALVAPVPRIALCMDTSGSMGKKEYEQAAPEIAGVLKSAGVPVDYLAIDCTIHEVQKLTNWKQAKFTGGGGTSFIPAFEWLAGQRPRHDVVVFLTDGDGAAPEFAPPGVKVIWVLTGAHARKAAEWGQSIFVDESRQT